MSNCDNYSRCIYYLYMDTTWYGMWRKWLLHQKDNKNFAEKKNTLKKLHIFMYNIIKEINMLLSELCIFIYYHFEYKYFTSK